jgi:SAM-dependent methyltransferase
MDRWDGGNNYDIFMGRWSRLVASEFVRSLGAQPGLRWLDVGCGTGALTEAIVSDADASAVSGVDPSRQFAELARQRLGDQVDLRVASGEDLPFVSGSFDVVASGLALNFIPDPVGALREWSRVAAAGGLVSVYVWDYAEGMELLRVFWDAVIDMDASASEYDEANRFPMCQPEPLADLFRTAGLSDVSTSRIEVRTQFASFDDYWDPFLSGQGPAPTYVSNLNASNRHQIRERLRNSFSSDGSLDLTARAWVATGSA